jgi:hypothetical protein
LKPLLERFPILFVGGIFNGDSIVTLADFAALLHLTFSLLWYIFKSRGGASETYLAMSSYRQQVV